MRIYFFDFKTTDTTSFFTLRSPREILKYKNKHQIYEPFSISTRSIKREHTLSNRMIEISA